MTIALQIQTGILAGRIGQELQALHGLSVGLQDTLSVILNPPPRDPSAVLCLQSIDRITQNLDDLGRLLNRIAEALNAVEAPDLAVSESEIVLRDLAVRLLALDQDGGQPQTANGLDEILWF